MRFAATLHRSACLESDEKAVARLMKAPKNSMVSVLAGLQAAILNDILVGHVKGGLVTSAVPAAASAAGDGGGGEEEQEEEEEEAASVTGAGLSASEKTAGKKRKRSSPGALTGADADVAAQRLAQLAEAKKKVQDLNDAREKKSSDATAKTNAALESLTQMMNAATAPPPAAPKAVSPVLRLLSLVSEKGIASPGSNDMQLIAKAASRLAGSEKNAAAIENVSELIGSDFMGPMKSDPLRMCWGI